MKGDKGKSKLIPDLKVKDTAPGKGLATILNDQYFAAPSGLTGGGKKSPKSSKGAAKTAKAASNLQGNNDSHYVLVNAGDTVEVSLETPESLQTVKQGSLKEPEPKVKDDSHPEAAELRQRNSELEREMATLKASAKSKEAADKMANIMASAEARYSLDKKRLAQAWQIEELQTSNGRSMAGAAKGSEKPEKIQGEDGALRAEVETLRWTVVDLKERAEASISKARGQQSSALLRAAFCESALAAVARRGKSGGGGAAQTGEAGGALALLRKAEAILPWQKKAAAAEERSQLLAAQLSLQCPSQEVAALRSLLAEKDALIHAREEEMEDLSRALKRTEDEFRRVEQELQEEQAETRDLRSRLKAATSQTAPVAEKAISAKSLSPIAMAAASALAASTLAASVATELSKPRASAVTPSPAPHDAKKKEGAPAVDSPKKTHKKKPHKKEPAQTPPTEPPPPPSAAPSPVPPPVLPVDPPAKTPKKKATKKKEVGTSEAPAPAVLNRETSAPLLPTPQVPSPALLATPQGVGKKEGAGAVDSPTKAQKKRTQKKKEAAALLNVGSPSGPSPSPPAPKAQAATTTPQPKPSTTTPHPQVKARATTPTAFVAKTSTAAAKPPPLAEAGTRPLSSPAALEGKIASFPAPVLGGGGHEEKTLLLQMKLKGARERALLAGACSGSGAAEVSRLSAELNKMGKVAATRKELLAVAAA